METQTRFDLTSAVENWRQELAAQPELEPDVRRELETHLHDTIADFQRRGLNDEESFWLAHRRIGPSRKLVAEFMNTEPAKIIGKYLFWAALAIVLNEFLGSVCWTIRLVSRESDLVTPLSVLMFMLFIALLMVGVVMATGRFSGLCSRLDSFMKSRSLFRFVMLMLVLLALLLDEFSWNLGSGGPGLSTHGSIPFLYAFQSASESMSDFNLAGYVDRTTDITVMFLLRLLTLMALAWVVLKFTPSQKPMTFKKA